MLDLLIEGGTVVDGTSAAGRLADVGIREGRVVAVGAGEDPALRRTFAPSTSGMEGRLVGEIAASQGKEPLDALLDIVVADRLRTVIGTPIRGDDPESWRLRAEAIRDPRTIAGGSDCGAHVDMLDTFSMNTALLGPCVRDRHMLTIEEAVHHLTGAPAALYGLVDRGFIREGAWADLFLFDPDTVGPGTVGLRHDMPGGAARLYSDPTGVQSVVVAGKEIVRGSKITGDLPGQVLRSGKDTHTVRVADVAI